ncbi:hypothetical protein [Actinomadura opuntiae]|uniref:hypothetical protein n=1 Tax=Actinomadura sp. OS1-43 TaxID=604315 RepID=UPI00255AAA9C|nr:hypothetical protein [Actinomadura sp. OS1-43]MDL4815149.1 hypothetical protein [Actinomadura sp. OS1-43]
MSEPGGRETSEPSEPRKASGSDSGADASDGPAGGPSQDQAINVVVNAFHDVVTAPGSAFGVSTVNTTVASAATGPLSSAVISTTVELYAEPEPFERALASLAENSAVALCGEVGCGKRTSAIALLRAVLPAEAPIVSLSPVATLDQLAKKRDYTAGQGYAVFDRLGREKGLEADHQWEVLRTRVRGAGAYLVVTTRERGGRRPESVEHFPWRRPALGAALSLYLGDTASEEAVAEVTELMPADAPMSDVVEVAHRIVQGDAPIDAVAAVLDQLERSTVRDWFDREPSREQILDITTMAFATGSNMRDFESCRSALETELAGTLPPPAAASPASNAGSPPPDAAPAPAPVVPDAIDQARRDRLLDHELIRPERVTVDGMPRRILVFREDRYRRYVLEELSDRFGIDFWNAVRAWLHGAVTRLRLQLALASGLALLAHSAFDEIEESYLLPWARGGAGWAGRSAAACTLWFMCLDEELAPIALRTADHWVGRGSSEMRLTGIIAFTGELGVRYPTEAPRRLWQLVRQRNDLSGIAAAAFGDLFANLVSRDGGGRQVVHHLSAQVNRLSPFGKDRVLYRESLRAALSVVRARVPGTGRPAIIQYLCDRPDEIPIVARMWAPLLRNRPFRHDALSALHRGLRDMGEMTSSAPEHARRFGNALGDCLSGQESELLARDFAKRTRNSKQADRSPALAQILIAALADAGRKRED